ncbi:G2/M phase-specific E3 ubiquitin-protein ligase-like isoform X2 [Micropterus salmoides]|uniref:G2/M phase-specific E3 ubiquitin-protein ligase-like isoform X2 n=1 Tax=Micropterus salmoides TaxID=27706 RepID=UPI0018EAFC2B|nr:G2/M phase-specific E3 ubiquitin-protein ligase-like isoform X2 [Micropterus salmoides]
MYRRSILHKTAWRDLIQWRGMIYMSGVHFTRQDEEYIQSLQTEQERDTLVPEETPPQNISSGSSDTTAGFLDLSHVKETTEPDLKTLLTTLASKVWIGETPSSNMINVCRENIMDGAMRAFTRRSFNPEAKLSVIFMDDFMQAEGSVDEGGPTRGFFRLLSEIAAYLQGHSKNLSLDSHALHRGLYRTYGVMMAVALLHGGVLPFFRRGSTKTSALHPHYHPLSKRLSEGLNTLGLLDLMKIHASILKEVFSSSERPLKATDLISLFQVTLSPPGSNRWRLEKRVEGWCV